MENHARKVFALFRLHYYRLYIGNLSTLNYILSGLSVRLNASSTQQQSNWPTRTKPAGQSCSEKRQSADSEYAACALIWSMHLWTNMHGKILLQPYIYKMVRDFSHAVLHGEKNGKSLYAASEKQIERWRNRGAAGIYGYRILPKGFQKLFWNYPKYIPKGIIFWYLFSTP